MQRNSDQDFFYFSRKEKNGIIIMSIIILILIAVPYLYEKAHPHENFLTVEYDSLFQDKPSAYQYDSAETINPGHRSIEKNNFENKQARLFRFDPNIISEEQWEELGVYPKTISTISNYLQKGGKFRKPEDLKKIWGLSEKKVAELLPYVTITELSTKREANGYQNQYNGFKQEIVELNSCDSAGLEKLPGIGPKLSQRIISYRERLGGFHSKEQLKEVFGLKDSVYELLIERVVIDQKGIHKLNINNADKVALKNHPYIRYKMADAILNYRNQHGFFTAFEQLKNIIIIDESSLQKLRPYLTVN